MLKLISPRTWLLGCAALLALSVAPPLTPDAQERITLTVPETVVSNQNYRVERTIQQPDDPATAGVDEGVFTIQLIGVERAVPLTCLYTAQTTPTGTFLINGMNKANFSTAYAGNASTGSFNQRIQHRLVVMSESTFACGKTLTGTLTGTPQ